MSGIKCPRDGCGCHDTVCVRTSKLDDGTFRSRKCAKCGFIFQTMEAKVGTQIVPEPTPKKKKKKEPKPENPAEPPKGAAALAMEFAEK